MLMLRHQLLCIRIIAVFFVYLLSFATLSAQEVRIVLSGTELPARDLFIQIERQTVYRFAYNSAVFDASQVINLPAAELSLREILDRVTEISRVTCLVHQDMVIIGPGKEEVPPPVIPPGIGRPPAVEDPETGDRYIATDICSLSALSRPDRSLPLDKSEPVQVIQVVVEPESRDSVGDLIDARLPASHRMPVESYVAYKGLPKVAAKTNLVHWIATASPNLSVEFGLGRRTSVEVYAANNRWKSSQSLECNKKLDHWMVRPEFRYWLCERMNGHFFGANVSYWNYNVSGYKIFSLFEKGARYKGDAFGLGLTYGYHMAVLPRWGLEFCAGIGGAVLQYDRFDCDGSNEAAERATRFCFGPGRVGISLVFVIK